MLRRSYRVHSTLEIWDGPRKLEDKMFKIIRVIRLILTFAAVMLGARIIIRSIETEAKARTHVSL